MKEEKVLIGQLTTDEIAALKVKYPGGIYAINNKNGKIAYFKKPSRNEVNCDLALTTRERPLANVEELAKLTFIGGCEDLLNNEDEALGSYEHLRSKMAGVEAELVNL